MRTAWEQARRLAYAAAQPLPPAAMALPDAAGTVLAEPVVALVDLPPFDHAAMDGYAVRGGQPWTVTGRVRPGDADPPPLSPGSACEIATGAPVPPGTDGVLPYEHGTVAAGRLTAAVAVAVPGGANIRRAGEECVAGEKLLAAGTTVTPAVAGLAAALGHDQLTVHSVPRLAALITGDELTGSGLPAAGRIRDAIGPMLPGIVGWAGGVLAGTSTLPDSAWALTHALDIADADVVLVSGSSSVGPSDHLGTGLRTLGGTTLVDGVACRPGHPQVLARLPGGRLVVGLPGNPLAALVAFLTLALPVIAGLRGAPLAELRSVTAAQPRNVTAADLPRHPIDTRLVPVRLVDGVPEALPHAGSAMLRGVAVADALAVIPPGDAGPVWLHPLPDGAHPWAG